MSAKGFLDHLLRSAQSGLESGGLAQRRQDGGLGISDLGKGALAGGAIGLLLGNKRARKMGGGLLKYGGAAALGALAYKAYGDWQREKAGAQAAAPQTLDRVAPPEQEAHSRAVLAAIVAAAKADGHVDERERALIEEGLSKLADAEGLRGWLQAELAKPLDPGEVARLATSPELASEIYLASALVIEERNFMERSYLDELSRQLGLEAGLRQQLDHQLAAG